MTPLFFLVLAWVTVLNPEGIRNDNGFFAFGDSCSIVLGERGVVVEDVGRVHDRMIYRYHTPQRRYGAPCPDGTLFAVAPEALAQLQEAATHEQTRQDVLRRGMQDLLAPPAQ